MARFRHSVVIQEVDFGGDVIRNERLGVNPLSMLLLRVRALNSTATLADYQSPLQLAAAINRFTLTVRGENIISARGEDLYALAYFRHGMIYPQVNSQQTTAHRREIVIPIYMGRHAFDSECCLPEQVEGDMVMEIDVDDADTGYTDLRLIVESIELQDAKPKFFERKLSKNHTFPGTGEQDFQLSLGNVNRGLLLWGTTGVTGAAPAPTWGRIRTRLDSMEVGYQSISFETAHGLHSIWGRQPPVYDGHKHGTTTDGNAQTSVGTLGYPYDVGLGWQQYAYLPFDHTQDDEYSVDASSARRFEVGSYNALAEAVRVVQIEKVPVGKLPARI
jgi:hypothetical protein